MVIKESNIIIDQEGGVNIESQLVTYIEWCLRRFRMILGFSKHQAYFSTLKNDRVVKIIFSGSYYILSFSVLQYINNNCYIFW